MNIEEIFDKTITDIYCQHKYEEGGLNYAECFIELDNKLLIGFPWSFDSDISPQTLDTGAKTIFVESSKGLFDLFKKDKPKISPIRHQKIVDYVYYEDSFDKGFFELANGGLISETNTSPQGTGKEGLNFFKDISELTSRFGPTFHRLSDKKSNRQ